MAEGRRERERARNVVNADGTPSPSLSRKSDYLLR